MTARIAIGLLLAASLPAQVAVNVRPTSPTTASVDVTGDPTPAFEFEVPLGSSVTAAAALTTANKSLSCADKATAHYCMVYGENRTDLSGLGNLLVVTFPAPPPVGLSNVLVSDPGGIAATSSVVVVPPPCDLTGDFLTDGLDVAEGVTQAQGTCGSADMNGDAACNVLDVMTLVLVALDVIACPRS